MNKQQHSHELPSVAKIIILSFGTWFLAGYDLILLPLLNQGIGHSFFPDIDPTNTILTIYGILSLSLLARIMGGILFGSLGDKYGRKVVLQWCTFLLGIIMLISAFIPDVYHPINENLIILNPLFFALTRILIGFFVGGIWPTGGVLAIENIYSKLNKNNSGSDDDFEYITKKYSVKSSILQAGFHTGYLVCYLLFIVLFIAPIFILPNYSEGDNNFICTISQLSSFVHICEPWRIMSLIGGAGGVFWTLICWKSMSESVEWQKRRKEQKQTTTKLQTTIELLEDKKSNSKLINFWLILTGLMYMYYSTIVILPEALLRNDISNDIFNIKYSSLIFIFLIVTLIAHLWPGFLCRYLWKTDKYHNLLVNIYNIISKPINKILKWKGESINLDAENKAVESNIDVMVIMTIGFVILLIGIAGLPLFYSIFSFIDKNNNEILSIKNIVIVYSSIVMLIANSGYALILPLLTSRFELSIRNRAASLVYNGSLVIGFASPFIAMQYFLSIGHEELMFVPMVGGAFAIMIGAKRYIQSWQDAIKTGQ